jgi:hypothetical protein
MENLYQWVEAHVEPQTAAQRAAKERYERYLEAEARASALGYRGVRC